MKYFTKLLFIILLLGCEDKSNYFTYSSFNSENRMVNKNECVFTYRKIDNNTISWEIKAQRGYSKNLIIKEDSNGVYWKCRDSFYLMIPYNLSEGDDYCEFYSPVVQQQYYKYSSKLVNLEKDKVEIIMYYGISGSHIGNTMYYVKGVGVLALCLTDRSYWLCTKTNHDKLNREDLSVLTKNLLSDTSFFFLKN